MSRSKTASEPKRRVSQACLAFDDEDALDLVPAKSVADRCVDPTAASSASSVADRAIVPCLEPGDPDADLEGLSNEDLRRHIDELGGAPDRRSYAVIRRFKAICVLKHREGLAMPPRTRPDPASVTPPGAKAQDATGRGRLRFGTVLGRVGKTAGPQQVEDLAQRLAEDLGDARSIRMFRRVAGWVRSGDVRPKVVSRAYALARRPGVERPAAVFTWYVFDRSPRVARARAARR